MAGVLPTKQTELITFAAVHLDVWPHVAASIGLTAAEIDAAVPFLTAAQDKAMAAASARDASKAATMGQTDAVHSLRTSLAGLVRKIKDFAESSANPMAVYEAAQIPAPATPTFDVPPNKPFDLSAALDYTTGFLNVRWKAAQPAGISGVVYVVFRTLTNSSGIVGAQTQVGATGEKVFTDVAVPAGTRQAVYEVRALRGSLSSAMSNALQVRFGVAGGLGGGPTITTFSIPASGDADGGSSEGDGEMKIAA